MKHSNEVGGSTAKRVMACPGSMALVQQMPPQVENNYMRDGTALHAAVDYLVNGEDPASSLLGKVFEGVTLTEDHIEKLEFALKALDEIDPDKVMVFTTETKVSFSGELEGVYGHTDLMGRIGKRAVVLDWKFGDGVIVEAEENEQGLFYTAAARRTKSTQWVFDGATEVEIIIVQPFQVRRWVTTLDRVEQFERDLTRAVKVARQPNAPLAHGDHCRFCTAKPVCPKMTGAVDRALKTQLDSLDATQIGAYLKNADLLEGWITDLRALALHMLESNKPVPGYKLVPRRAMRRWVDEDKAGEALVKLVPREEMYKEELLSPAQAEKVLKKRKMELPDDLVVAVSSGTTLAPESDPRSAVVQIGQQLSAALSKIV